MQSPTGEQTVEKKAPKRGVHKYSHAHTSVVYVLVKHYDMFIEKLVRHQPKVPKNPKNYLHSLLSMLR